MAANRQDVNGWIQRAINNKCQYIISVCDTYDWDDYPVFCENKGQVLKESIQYNGVNMQRINEIIRINDDGTVTENLNINNL